MNWQEFTALLVLATAMSFSPGPNTTLSTALAANHGLKRAMPFVCAVPVGWGVLLTVCALGLGALILAVPLLGWAVKLVGVSYLLWLASKIARSNQLGEKLIGVRFQIRDQPQASGNGRFTPERNWNLTPINLFWQGAALQFVNIKAWMLALAIVGGWITGRADPGQRFAVVLPVMLAFAFSSNLAYALLGSLLRDWLAGPSGSGRRLLVFNRIMALVLVATAIWMLFI
ncbi:MAG: LysE family translocator [Polaromonas sp.]|nr:LysE family translocator [Polaromonas sp.]